jgi:AcrR family transcriptional regulator
MGQTKWTDIDVTSLAQYNAETHRMTIENIQEALNMLLQTKSFDKITVTDIVKKAGVSRTAFYRNYNSKEEVIQSVIHDSFASMMNEIRSTHIPENREFWRSVILRCIDYSVKFKCIGNGKTLQGSMLLDCMNEYFGELILPFVKYGDEMQMRFWMGGMNNVVRNWLDNGMKESPSELTDKILNYIGQV